MHMLSGSHCEVGQMSVASADAVTVVDHDGAAIAAHEIGKDHHAVGGSHHALTIRRCDVHPAVKCPFTVERIDSFAERSGDVAFYGPDIRSRIGSNPVRCSHIAGKAKRDASHGRAAEG